MEGLLVIIDLSGSKLSTNLTKITILFRRDTISIHFHSFKQRPCQILRFRVWPFVDLDPWAEGFCGSPQEATVSKTENKSVYNIRDIGRAKAPLTLPRVKDAAHILLRYDAWMKYVNCPLLCCDQLLPLHRFCTYFWVPTSFKFKHYKGSRDTIVAFSLVKPKKYLSTLYSMIELWIY